VQGVKLSGDFRGELLKMFNTTSDIPNIKIYDEKIILKINDILKKGNSIEIHPAKDGVRIYEIRKKRIE
jgi:hypothetical protein